MITEITKEIVDAIRNNQKDFLSDSMQIIGVLAGVVGGLFSGMLLGWWGKRGKIVLMPMEMEWRYGGSVYKVYENPYTSEAPPESISFVFKLRVSNLYPDPKGFALTSVEFLPKQSHWRSIKPVLRGMDLKWKVIGEDLNPNDIYLPAHSSTQIQISGYAVPTALDKNLWPYQLQAFRSVFIQCVVTPKRRVRIFYSFKNDEIHDSDLEPFLQNELYNAKNYGPTEQDFAGKTIDEYNRQLINLTNKAITEIPIRLAELQKRAK